MQEKCVSGPSSPVYIRESKRYQLMAASSKSAIRPPSWQILLAFGIIYLVWGSTFLAIRVGVHEVPPLLLAAMRFLVAGIALYGWMMAKGERSPSGRQWM